VRIRHTRLLLLVALCAGVAAPVQARHARHAPQPELTLSTVNQAGYSDATKRGAAPATMIKAEVLLDRLGFSPGMIDGKPGENVGKAIAAFQQARGLAASGRLDQATWDKLAETSSEPAVIEYTITADDARGPFVKIPHDLEDMARLERLGYNDLAELLAEKFHAGDDLLKALNPGKTFDRAGMVISVPNVAKDRPDGAVATVEVDKRAKAVRALGRDGKLVAFYPASIGSTEKPAPSGTFGVRRIVRDPDYEYDPKFNFKSTKAKTKLTIAPGPNNPVGAVWIELTKPSYGIHGTANPEKVGKTESHGCVRLTNWDALDLARRIHKGAQVMFLDDTRSSSR
jgi:lipoprotein-anchoring transpeptidase ErfK/SrfK